MLGRIISGTEAASTGLVNHACDGPDRVFEKVVLLIVKMYRFEEKCEKIVLMASFLVVSRDCSGGGALCSYRRPMDETDDYTTGKC